MIRLLDDTTNQLSKFRTRNWVDINDEWEETYNYNSDIKFKTSMPRSNLRNFGDAYIHVKATITVKNCVPFTSCIKEINNTKVDDT